MNMISVLVVDDEPLLLKGFMSIIEKANPNFRIVGSAYDGREALEKMNVLHPQVVFTDIKMPGMDGLTFLSLAQKQCSNFIPVILSGHDDFEFARKSIQLGVAEYLLKPVKLALLGTLLDNLYEKIYSKFLMDQIVLLESLLSDNANIKKITELFGGYSNFTCILICAGSFDNMKTKSMEPTRNFWKENNLKVIIKDTLKINYDYWVIDWKYENQKIVIFAKNDLFIMSDIVYQNAFYEKLLEFNFPITYIYGKPFCDLQELNHQVNYRQMQLIRNGIFCKSIKISNDSPNENNRTNKINLPIFENLLNNNQLSLFVQNAINYIKSLQELSCSQINLEILCKQLVTMLLNKISNSQIISYSDINLEVTEIINHSFTYEHLLKGISNIFERLLQLNNNFPTYQSDHQQLSNNIQTYIDNNFNKHITLGTLSGIYGLVPSYLSKIFHMYKGISPIDYLTKVRIKEAKKLLISSPPIILKDVAQLVGYDDPYNFSKIFKKTTGKNPSEYRNNYKLSTKLY